MSKLPIGDKTLSAKEIIANESQERMGLLIDEKYISEVQKIADRERAPMYVVGDTTDGTILLAEMPVKTTLKITHSEPGVKGNTATNATKPATLETGAEVRVPLFINEGETIQIDTRDGSYLGRVSE